MIFSGIKCHCGVFNWKSSILFCAASEEKDTAWTARLKRWGLVKSFWLYGNYGQPVESPVASSKDGFEMQVGICRDTVTDMEKGWAAFQLFFLSQKVLESPRLIPQTRWSSEQRIIEWFYGVPRFECTLEDHPVQNFVEKEPRWRYLRSAQFYLENFQWWGLYRVPGKVVPVTGCSHSKKKIFLISRWNVSWCILYRLSLVLPMWLPMRRDLPFMMELPFKHWKTVMMFPLKPSVLQDEII